MVKGDDSSRATALEPTIASLDNTGRWMAFKREVIAPIVADYAERGFAALDEEEKGLLVALRRLYRVRETDVFNLLNESTWWREMVERGASIQRPDELLGLALAHRLFEADHVCLDEREFQRVRDWLARRHGVTARDPDREDVEDPFVTRLVALWEAYVPRSGPTEGTDDSDDEAPAQEQPPPPPPELPAPKQVRINLEEVRARVVRLCESNAERSRRTLDALQELGDADDQWLALAAFAEHRATNSARVLIVPEEASDLDEVWFAGDAHGDVLAFEACIDAFERNASRNARLIFLGDLVDDGFHEIELIASLWRHMLASPGRFGWIAGNHDEALRWSGDEGRFTSSVTPSSFADVLNGGLRDGLSKDLGLAFIRMVDVLPRAMFFPGLLAAHGGFPHRDTWETLETPQHMEDSTCLGDFVWNRWSDQRYKYPNRGSSQSTFGAEDFMLFRDVATRLGLPIEGMVRGHDHVNEVPERWARKTEVTRSSYEGRILTINTLCYNQRREVSPYVPPNPRTPVLARWRPGDVLPTPIFVRIPADTVAWYAPTCPACNQPSPTGSVHCTARTVTAEEETVCGQPLATGDSPCSVAPSPNWRQPT